jgi:hypothetical protein
MNKLTTIKECLQSFVSQSDIQDALDIVQYHDKARKFKTRDMLNYWIGSAVAG